MQKTIINFINLFNDNQDIVEKFTRGCCYYFAVILKERFDAEIVYDPIENHFACRIEDNVYDITGMLDEPQRFLGWNDYKKMEPMASLRIKKHCIDLKG